ncbi:MAG: tetratricopeptide repeat protein, partial [Rhodobacteraceae bacterium]|nr:tetratricopeptide repeat protein [Paracoccaceae bacterium]
MLRTPLMALAFLCVTALPLAADLVEDCLQDNDLDLKIGSCTAAIRSGHWAGEELAWTYNNRGRAYSKLGEYDTAVTNFDQAIRLSPGFSLAYYNRGKAQVELGKYEAAFGDFNQSLSIDP